MGLATKSERQRFWGLSWRDTAVWPNPSLEPYASWVRRRGRARAISGPGGVVRVLAARGALALVWVRVRRQRRAGATLCLCVCVWLAGGGSQLPQPFQHRRIAFFLLWGKRRWSSRRFGFRCPLSAPSVLVHGFRLPGTATRCRFSLRELHIKTSQLRDFRNRPCRIGHTTTSLGFGIAVCSRCRS